MSGDACFKSEVLQIENVHVRVNVDVESHPVGSRSTLCLSLLLNELLHLCSLV